MGGQEQLRQNQANAGKRHRQKVKIKVNVKTARGGGWRGVARTQFAPPDLPKPVRGIVTPSRKNPIREPP
jgi:hypothetical protein